MPPLFNPLPFVFIFATAFGVVMHDTRTDRAASVAIVMPMAGVSNLAASDAITKSNEHVHVERVAVPHQGDMTHHENITTTQPRDDHNKYLQVKKYATSSGSGGLWPSI